MMEVSSLRASVTRRVVMILVPADDVVVRRTCGGGASGLGLYPVNPRAEASSPWSASYPCAGLAVALNSERSTMCKAVGTSGATQTRICVRPWVSDPCKSFVG